MTNQGQLTTIVIPTAGRAAILHETVAGLATQQQLPHLILISAADANSMLEQTRALPGVEAFIAPKRGSSAQRNAALERVTTPYTLFLDDDVELAPNYIEVMQALLNQRKDIAIVDGEMASDGAHTDSGYTHEKGRTILLSYTPTGQLAPIPSATGCCFVRTEVARAVRFDERLPLYSYLEDLDFSTRARKFGSIQRTGRTALVHLGASSGRVSGLRLGYSQIMNPFYLWRKNGYPGLSRVLLHFWLRLFLSNLVRSLIRSSGSRADRPGRLKGNLLAFADLLRLRVDPERILTL